MYFNLKTSRVLEYSGGMNCVIANLVAYDEDVIPVCDEVSSDKIRAKEFVCNYPMLVFEGSSQHGKIPLVIGNSSRIPIEPAVGPKVPGD